jgi:hypothetical protein
VRVHIVGWQKIYVSFLKEQAGKVKHLLSECMCEWRILCGDGIYFFDMFVAAA